MLALADGHANPNESATAAAMAERLMLRYGLDRAAVLRDAADAESDWIDEGAADPAGVATRRRRRRRQSAGAARRARQRHAFRVVGGLAALVGLLIAIVLLRPAPVEDPSIQEAIGRLLSELDGTTPGALRAIRAHDDTPVTPPPSPEQMHQILFAANRQLPVQVDEVTWINRVRAFDGSIIYEFEIRDPRAAEMLRGLSPSALKERMAHAAARAGADVCKPIREANRHFRITSSYFDADSRPINSFSYELGECLSRTASGGS